MRRVRVTVRARAYGGRMTSVWPLHTEFDKNGIFKWYSSLWGMSHPWIYDRPRFHIFFFVKVLFWPLVCGNDIDTQYYGYGGWWIDNEPGNRIKSLGIIFVYFAYFLGTESNSESKIILNVRERKSSDGAVPKNIGSSSWILVWENLGHWLQLNWLHKKESESEVLGWMLIVCIWLFICNSIFDNRNDSTFFNRRLNCRTKITQSISNANKDTSQT